MNSRERVARALSHQEPDRVPLDLGGSATTGMNVSSVYLLRQALQLDPPGTPVKVIEPFQMLGEIAPDLQTALGVDVAPLSGPLTFFGFRSEDWKPWTTFDATPVLVPGAFNTQPDENGDILMFPEGDRSVPPSGRMPAGGFYFDAIVRQEPLDEAALDVEDNLEEFGPVSEGDLAYFASQADWLWRETDRAIVGNFGGTSFGDIALVPATQLKHPRGIRDIAEWYMSTIARHDYVYRIFERQCEIALANLRSVFEAVGNRISVIFVSGTDFGMQTGPFIGPATYRELYQPFHKQINGWIHQNTTWKTFIHSCGSVIALLPDFIESGFDVLNPVQLSATGMDPKVLKERFGDQIVFWGGGIDTQQVLPFGTPDEVRAQVRERIATLGANGGFVFNTIHNVQAGTPVANLQALYSSVQEFGRYPLNR